MTDSNPSRRSVLKSISTGTAMLGTSGLVAGKPNNGKGNGSGNGNKKKELDDKELERIAIETAANPVRPVIAFTTTVFGDGLELYVAKGIEDPSEVPKSITRLTNSEAGVHGPSWESPSRLRYSQDGQTLERTSMGASQGGGNVKVVDDNPLPVRQDQATILSGFVFCSDLPFVTDYCIRLDGSDSGHSPQCASHSPPTMTHGHFAIYQKGNYRSGINIWVGHNGNCFWVGEEHYTEWCTRICGPEGGTPSLSDLKNAFEEAINRAANAAGIAIPGIVVTALAYYLAASTLAPPTGVPGV